MASGNYNPEIIHTYTNCEGGDSIKIGSINDSWTFYDPEGKKVTASEEQLELVNQVRAIDLDGFSLPKEQ